MPATEGTTATQTTATAAAPATGGKGIEAELAAKIDASGLLSGDEPHPGKPAAKTPAAAPAKPGTRTAAPPKEAEDDDTTDTEAEASDEPGTEAGEETDQTPGDDEDEGSEDSTIPAAARRQIDDLRTQIAELNALIRGKGKDAIATADSASAAALAGKADQIESDFADIRKHLKDNQSEEVAKDLGLDQLLDKLEARDKAQRDEKANAEKAQKEQREAQSVSAANNIHKAINNVSRADPELTKILGIGRHETLEPKFLQARGRIMAAAVRAMQDAQEEVHSKQRKTAMTESEALAIGIKRVTGKDVGAPKNPADAQAKERARMVRAAGGGSTSKEGGQKSQGEVESGLAAQWDKFLKE